MKNILFVIIVSVLFSSCSDLDLKPLAEGSSESWYSTEVELTMSVNDLFRDLFWPVIVHPGQGDPPESWTDNWLNRQALTSVTSGSITSEWGVANTIYWFNSYQCITRCNTILASLNRISEQISGQKLNDLEGQVYFVRACQYAKLIFHFGDVIFYTEPLMDINAALTMSRTDKNVVLQKVYEDFDMAAGKLPLSYASGEIQYATKGSAYGMKARAALWNGDYAMARTAAKACMDLGYFQLYPDFSTLFLSSTKNSIESVFALPRSIQLGLVIPSPEYFAPRNPGGYANFTPTWDLFCAFLCTDGLPIDKSPLFDPREPFKNRDPRCSATIVKFETPFMGFMYQPHPDSLEVMNFTTGMYQTNNDSRGNAQFASFTGLVWKKGIDETWLQAGTGVDPDKIFLRYADVLLMYAESKIELNDIDQSVLDAINQVRARAYGVEYTETDKYPAVTTMNQAELRKILRVERRMEFAFEGSSRYDDLIRWRLAEKVLNTPLYGMLDPEELREKVVDPGLWFFPEIPPVDEDGIADFSGMYSRGLIKLLVERSFPSRQYLWPIPAKDMLINPNLTQNPGY